MSPSASPPELYELNFLAAVVVVGTSLSGGEGKMPGNIGAPQKNDAAMSVDESSAGIKKKGRKAQEKPEKEVALALDPGFD